MSDVLANAAMLDTMDDMVQAADMLWEGHDPMHMPSRLFQRLLRTMMLALAGGTSPQDDKISHAYQEGILKYADETWWRVKSSPRVQHVFKEVIDLLLSKKPTLSVLSSKDLEPRLRQTAWYIAGEVNKNLLNQIKDIMISSRMAGESKQTFIDKVAKLTDRSAAHLENVFRTNISSATGAARWAEWNDPDNTKDYFGYLYVAKQDERARPLHRLMDGFAAVKDDRLWRIIWVPNGYNCRCKIRPLRLDAARELGLVNREGETIKERVFVNRFQRRIVDIAELDTTIFIGKRMQRFPDDGFRGNSLMDLVA